MLYMARPIKMDMECMVCHSRAANYVLGLSTLQMNRDHDYGGRVDNQLRTLEHLELLKPSKPPAELGHLVDERNTSYMARERYAEWFAIQYGYRATGGSRSRPSTRPPPRRANREGSMPPSVPVGIVLYGAASVVYPMSRGRFQPCGTPT